MDHSKILGTVLAGGKSQRFGEDKSQVQLGNQLLIDYVLAEIIDVFNEIIIVSNNPIKFNQSEKISLIKDFKNNLGPLGGVLSAMKWIKENNKDYQWVSTMISWSYYGLQSWKFLFGRGKAADMAYKLLFLLFVIIGASASMNSIWAFSDAMIFAMVFPNMVGLYFLFPVVKKQLKRYTDAIKESNA